MLKVVFYEKLFLRVFKLDKANTNCINEVYETWSTVQSFLILAANVWWENLRRMLKSLQANCKYEHSIIY